MYIYTKYLVIFSYLGLFSVVICLVPVKESKAAGDKLKLSNSHSKFVSNETLQEDSHSKIELGRLLSTSSVVNGCYVSEEVHLNSPELIKRKGFPFEAHTIKTADGYILTAHRIPAPGKPVVVAFHGMFQSSRDFLMNCERKAFAYKMADAGFDVWLANVRGNCYSRCHATLNANEDPAYWDFTVDTVIKYDAPAIIDYILNTTGEETLNWVGYSLGTAVALGLGSVHPEYNEKINLLFLMGTTAHNGNTKSPLIRALSPLASLQDMLMTKFNHGETLPLFMYPIMRTLLPILCLPEAKLNFLGFCSYFLYIVAGFDQPQSNPTILPMMLGGTPGSLSVKMLSQWYQWVEKGQFSYYDYGQEVNMKKYGKATPPNYDLTKVTGKVVNMWAQNDWLSVPQDVEQTVKELPNVIFNIKIAFPTFNHLDFIYGKDADIYVYDRMIDIIRMYT